MGNVRGLSSHTSATSASRRFAKGLAKSTVEVRVESLGHGEIRERKGAERGWGWRGQGILSKG
jgi:hypothetical protein